jgi:glycosyltransferase involved in cell wall biosynthesis
VTALPASPLRVLGYYSFPGGGIGRYTHHLMEALGRIPELQVALLAQPNYEWRREATYTVMPDLFAISHPAPPVRKARFLLSQLVNPRRLAARARDKQPQVIHLADVNHLFLPAWRSAVFGRPWLVAMTVHDVKRLTPILARRWEDWQLREVYRRCDALFVHSRAQRDELIEYAGVEPGRVHIVPHGPYPAARYEGSLDRAGLRARWGVPAAAQVVLFFGFIKPYKGLEVLLQAVAGLDRAHPLHVLVAGSGGGRYQAYEDECRRLIASPGLQGRVTAVLRHVEEAEIPELLELSDAISLPYREAFTSQSGVLNLASHARRPIVASPAPAFFEGQASGEIGVIAADFSVEAYRAALLQLLESPGRPWAFDRYLAANSWERNAELTAGVYRRLVAGNR